MEEIGKRIDIIWNDKSKYVPKLPLKSNKVSTFDIVAFRLKQISAAEPKDLEQYAFSYLDMSSKDKKAVHQEITQELVDTNTQIDDKDTYVMLILDKVRTLGYSDGIKYKND